MKADGSAPSRTSGGDLPQNEQVDRPDDGGAARSSRKPQHARMKPYSDALPARRALDRRRTSTPSICAGSFRSPRWRSRSPRGRWRREGRRSTERSSRPPIIDPKFQARRSSGSRSIWPWRKPPRSQRPGVCSIDVQVEERNWRMGDETSPPRGREGLADERSTTKFVSQGARRRWMRRAAQPRAVQRRHAAGAGDARPAASAFLPVNYS